MSGEQHFLLSLVLIIGVSTLTVWLFHIIKVPSIIGFLAAGVLIGPYGFSFITSTNEIELFADIGIMLLLFTLGLEFSVKELLKLKKLVFGAGLFQIFLTVLVVFILLQITVKLNWQSALLWGFMISLSSTAVVFKHLTDKGQTNTPHGRSVLSIALAQDLMVVIFIIILPMIAFKQDILLTDVFKYIMQLIVIFVFFFFGSKWLVPLIFQNIIKTASRELFIFSILFFCLGTALFTNMLGLSLSLGAFLAGVMISESEYAHQALSDVIPFKESFLGIFFVSIGMLLNLNTIIEYAPIVIAIVLGIILLKAIVTFLAVYIFDGSIKNAYISGFSLAQIGEFSFILANMGILLNIFDPIHYQVFLAGSIVTMLATPFLIEFSQQTSKQIISIFFSKSISRHNLKFFASENFLSRGSLNNHVVIIGFGFHGKNIAQVLKKANIPYVAVDNDLQLVRKYRSKGEPIFFGDASSPNILLHLGLKKANVIICTTADSIIQRTVIANVRQHNKCAYIIIRSKQVNEVEKLKQLGANDVIPEEFETTMEILHRTLMYFQMPTTSIEQFFEEIRTKHYSIMTESTIDKISLLKSEQCIPQISTFSILIEKDFYCVGKSLSEIDFFSKVDIVLLAIRRNNQLLTQEITDISILQNDILILNCNYQNYIKALNILNGNY